MKILGLEIRKIKKRDIPQKVKNKSFMLDSNITDKGKDYLFGLKGSLFGLKGSPFTIKKNQGYLHYDGICIANNRVYFMWKDDEIASIGFIGLYTGDSFTISGITGKQKIDIN